MRAPSIRTDRARGGAIYAVGLVTVTDSTISNNTSFKYSGGGIFTFGSVTVTNSIISGNTSSELGNDTGEGGGIFAGLHDGSFLFRRRRRARLVSPQF